MRTFSLFFLFLLGFFSVYAQHIDLIENDWYVDYIIVDDVTYESPIPGYPLINTNIDFFETTSNAILDVGSDSFFSDITYGPLPNEFTFTDMAITLPGCYNYCDFAPFYWDFLTGGLLEIESHFTFTVNNNSDGTKSLLITHDNGNVGSYNNYPPLGIADKKILSFTLHPNPVFDQLYMTTENVTFTHFLIYDISGKMIRQDHFIQNAIDVSALLSGMYFIKVVGEHGTSIKQFVKE